MKIVTITLLIFFTIVSISNSEIKDCSKIKKLSKEYIQCQKNNLGDKSSEYGITKKVKKYKKK